MLKRSLSALFLPTLVKVIKIQMFGRCGALGDNTVLDLLRPKKDSARVESFYIQYSYDWMATNHNFQSPGFLDFKDLLFFLLLVI